MTPDEQVASNICLIGKEVLEVLDTLSLDQRKTLFKAIADLLLQREAALQKVAEAARVVQAQRNSGWNSSLSTALNALQAALKACP